MRIRFILPLAAVALIATPVMAQDRAGDYAAPEYQPADGPAADDQVVDYPAPDYRAPDYQDRAAAPDRRGALRGMDADKAARLLSNPAVQAGLANVLVQMTDAFLDTRVGPMAMLAPRREGVRPNDTLGDVMRRDDPDFDRKLRANTRRSLAMAGGAVRGAAAMNRELKATAARMRRVLDRAGGY